MIVPFSREPRDNLLYHISYAKEQPNIAVTYFVLDNKKAADSMDVILQTRHIGELED